MKLEHISLLDLTKRLDEELMKGDNKWYLF